MHQMLLGIVSYLDWVTGMTQLVEIQIGIVVVSATWSHAALLGDPVQILSCLRFHMWQSTTVRSVSSESSSIIL
jgi:hypothetical protein